ncbi:MAG: hypothetical protein ACI857_001944 [Arenicella sp.]|jgi:hypothetical protein
MNLQEIRKNNIRKAEQKLNRHKNMGAESNLSINEVAELLDVVHGMANEEMLSPQHLIGNYSLN